MPGGLGQAREVIESLIQARGLIRPREVEAAGVSREWLHILAGLGFVERVASGVFGAPRRRYSPEALAATKVPGGIICMASALALHGWKDAAPRQVWMAIGQSAWKPSVLTAEARFARLSSRSLRYAVQTLNVCGVTLRAFSVAKSIIDCWAFRRRLGLAHVPAWTQRALEEGACTADEIAEALVRGAGPTAARRIARSFPLRYGTPSQRGVAPKACEQ